MAFLVQLRNRAVTLQGQTVHVEACLGELLKLVVELLARELIVVVARGRHGYFSMVGPHG